MNWQRLFLILLCWGGILESAEIHKVPVLYQGRYRPFGVLPKEEQQLETALFLPLRSAAWQQRAGEWGPLSLLRQSRENFTSYQGNDFEAIREAYLSEDEQTLATALLRGYAPLAHKIYKQAAGKSLQYPSLGQLRMELFLHRFPLTIGILTFYLSATACLVLRQKKLGLFLLITGFILHSFLLLSRCYVLERPPVTSMTETLLYVPWVAVAVALLFFRHSLVLISSAIAGVILLFLTPDKQDFTNVQAVLDSQMWLLIHVLMVVGSYGIFLLSGILGHIYLLQKQPSSFLEKKILQFLYAGTILLICGTILGGIWAAQSWGRFWDWDPKESWAFISSGVYLAWIHAYQFKKIRGTGLAVGAIFGFISITFTWYGVNYLLGTGLHSYGFGSGGEWAYYTYTGAEMLFLGFFPWVKKWIYSRLNLN